MKPPIIIDESGDVAIFETAETASVYLEPPDIINEEYVAYDSEGRLLKLSLSDSRMPINYERMKIIIEPTEAEPSHASDLRKILMRFLSYLGISKDWVVSASLKDLVSKSLEYKTR